MKKIDVTLLFFFSSPISYLLCGESVSQFRDVELSTTKPSNFVYKAELTTHQDKNKQEFHVVDYSNDDEKIKFQYIHLTSEQKKALQLSLASPKKYPCFMIM